MGYILIVIYIIATLINISYIITTKKVFGKIGVLSLYLAFIIHTIYIILAYVKVGYTPVTNINEGLSFLAWCVVGIYILLQYRYKITILGAFASPLALILIYSSSIIPQKIILRSPLLKSLWLPIHVSLLLAGEGIFALAFCAGIMYLIQERQLKSKKVGIFYYRLPSLYILDEINARCLMYGFPLLTLGIITGSIWAEYAWGSYWNWDPKETFALITWLIYAALIHGRLATGWRGRRAAIMAIIGFFSILFTFMGVAFIFPKSLHNLSNF
jgi:cytochrome c-type biogenesis protein CcsB